MRSAKFGGGVAVAVAMDFFAEPFPQRTEFAATELRGEIAEVGLGLGEELGRVQIAQRVGGKVAEQPRTPVHVLQHPVGIGGGHDAQVLAVLVVPRARAIPPPSSSSSSSAFSSSNRIRMCRLYVTSSASTRISEGRTSLIAP